VWTTLASVTSHRWRILSQAAGLQSSPRRADYQSTLAHVVDYALDSAAGCCRRSRRRASPTAERGLPRAAREPRNVAHLAIRTSIARHPADTQRASLPRAHSGCACSASRSERPRARFRLYENRRAQLSLAPTRSPPSLRLAELRLAAKRGGSRQPSSLRLAELRLAAKRGGSRQPSSLRLAELPGTAGAAGRVESGFARRGFRPTAKRRASSCFTKLASTTRIKLDRSFFGRR